MDQCRHCIVRGDIAACEQTDCDKHEYWYTQSLRARVARLEEALPDPYKLEILARWFDMKYPSDANPEVQTDLREWAKKIRRALEEK